MSKFHIERLLCKRVHNDDPDIVYPAYYIFDEANYQKMLFTDVEYIQCEPMVSLFDLFYNYDDEFNLAKHGVTLDDDYYDSAEVNAVYELADFKSEDPDRELFSEEYWEGDIIEWHNSEFVPILATHFSEFFDIWFGAENILPEHESVLEKYCKEHERKWKPVIIIKKSLDD